MTIHWLNFRMSILAGFPADLSPHQASPIHSFMHHPKPVFSYAHTVCNCLNWTVLPFFKKIKNKCTTQSMTSQQDKGANTKSRPPKALETLSGALRVLFLWLGQHQSLSFSPVLRIRLGLFLHSGRMHYNRPCLEQEPYRCRGAGEQVGAEGGEEELWKLKGATREPLASFQSG